MGRLRFDKPEDNGLSIIYITAFNGLGEIINQTSSKLQMGISPFAQYHEREGLSRPSQHVRRFQTTVYKEYPNTPIYTYKTISSGIWPNRRFEDKGLKEKV
jgi:hypothetical protein